MKNIFFVICFLMLFLALDLKGQNNYGIAEYNTTLRIGDEVSAKSKLVFNSKKSVFFEGKFRRSRLDNQNARIIFYDSTQTNYIKYYTNLQSNKIHKYHNLLGEKYLIEENLYHIKWELKNEFDLILGFKCQKAEAYFRGRQYVAWFTPEIAVSLGPWKLNGLPGLILKAEDISNQVNFQITKISSDKKENLEKHLLSPQDNEILEISIIDYLEIMNNKESEKMNKIMTMMPRGTTISNVKMSGRNSKMEITYEWEENKN